MMATPDHVPPHPTAPGPVPVPPWQQMEGPWGSEPQEPEINLMEYVRLVWKKKWIVLAVVLLTTTIASVRALTQPKLYRSATKISLDVQVKEDDSVKELRDATLELVAQQRRMIESGAMNAKEVAEGKLITGDFKRLEAENG